jgi:hypothetical protein
MFKVRKRSTTNVGTPIPPSPRAPAKGSSPPGRAGTDDDTGETDRTWLVRLEDGEIKTCRELATLQKWIVAGAVSKKCEISRTGKKWKRLGDIGELASFFPSPMRLETSLRPRTAPGAMFAPMARNRPGAHTP